LNLPKLKLEFNEDLIPYKDVEDKEDKSHGKNKDTRTYLGWVKSKSGQTFAEAISDGGSMFGYTKVNRNDAVKTVVSSNGTYEWHDIYFRKLNNFEYKQIGTYPLDYNFKTIEPKYLIGMSVPPVMTAQIATEIAKQWFKITAQ
jgi:DNA (cytosine-5)-methyltransferase 1